MLQRKTYQARHQGPHFFETTGPNAPKWYIVDAKDQVVGRLATVLARVITGKHKPTYTRHADAGDFVVVLNCDKVVFTRNKWNDKLYRDHSTYIGGLKTKTAREMRDRAPEEILKRAVWGMTNNSSLARHQIKKLKLFTGSEHPHRLPVAATRRTVLTAGKKSSK